MPGLAVVVAEADRLAVALVGPDRVAQLGQPRVGLLGAELARPTGTACAAWARTRRSRRCSGCRAVPLTCAAGRDDPLGQVGDLQHVLVGLGRQAAHEVELHLAPAGRVRGGDRADEVVLGDHLVDDLADPLGAALGGERQPGAAAVAGQLVGQVDVERVDAGRGQRQRGLGALVAVGQALGDVGDLGVVGAGQREQARPPRSRWRPAPARPSRRCR